MTDGNILHLEGLVVRVVHVGQDCLLNMHFMAGKLYPDKADLIDK